ncbi:MAG TPA: hypothetical protein VF737_02455 [Gemmatimonadaceae bacterium]
MTRTPLPQWTHRAKVGRVGVLTLKDGECLTVDVRRIGGQGDRLVVDVVPPTPGPTSGDQQGREIPVASVVDFQPGRRAELPWPYSDPCRGRPFSPGRLALMGSLFLGFTAGPVAMIPLIDVPYGLQIVTGVAYTLLVTFLTFARVRSNTSTPLPSYLFTCPAVRQRLARLVLRHAGFLVVLFALEALGLAIGPRLPAWWTSWSGGRGVPPLFTALSFLGLALAWAEIGTNRWLIDRAHREFSTG